MNDLISKKALLADLHKELIDQGSVSYRMVKELITAAPSALSDIEKFEPVKELNPHLYAISGYGDESLVSKGSLYKAIDEFTKRWDGKIVDPIEIRSLIRNLPETKPPCTNDFVSNHT